MEAIARQHPLFRLAMVWLILQLILLTGYGFYKLPDAFTDCYDCNSLTGLLPLSFALLNALMVRSFYLLRSAGQVFFVVINLLAVLSSIIFLIVGSHFDGPSPLWLCLVSSLLWSRVFWLIYIHTEQPKSIEHEYYNPDGTNKLQEQAGQNDD